MSELTRKSNRRFDALYFRVRERDAFQERLNKAIRQSAIHQGELRAQRAEIERLTAERDALQQRLEWVKRDYAAGEYTAMALNLFDGEQPAAPAQPQPTAQPPAAETETSVDHTPFNLRKARDLIYDGRGIAELSRIEIAMLNLIVSVENVHNQCKGKTR